MSLHNTTAYAIVGRTATESLPDPTTVSGRVHMLVNAHTASATWSSTGATPFSVDGVNSATFILAAGQAIQFQSDGTRWTAKASSFMAATSTPWVRDVANTWIYPVNYTTDHMIVGSNQMDDAGGTDRDHRMFYKKSTGAFRAGRVTGTQWNSANLGARSVAFGDDTTASGADSFACGATASATASETFAQGQATANTSGAAAFGGSTGSGTRSFACNDSTASGDRAFSSGNGATASGGTANAINMQTSAAGRSAFAGGEYGSAARFGQEARGGYFFAAQGDRQINRFVAARTTTDATASTLLFDGGGVTANTVTLTGANTNVLTIPVSKAHRFRIEAMARRTDVTGDAAGFSVVGTIIRASAGSAAFISAPVVTTDATAGAATWTLAVTINTADATNNYLQITVTGEAAKTIRWAAKLETTEVG